MFNFLFKNKQSKIKVAPSFKIPIHFEDGSIKDVLIFDESSKYYLGENRLTPKIYTKRKDCDHFSVLTVDYFTLKMFILNNAFEDYTFYTEKAKRLIEKWGKIPKAIVDLSK